MIKAKSIRHTGVPVSDVRKAKRFYGEILGLGEIERPKIKGVPGAWYEVDGTQVHIIGQRNTMADKDIPGIGTPHRGPGRRPRRGQNGCLRGDG